MSNKTKKPAAEETAEQASETAAEESAASAGQAENADAAPETAEAKPDETKAQLESLKAELAAEKDRSLRLMAEYDNYRKRSVRERDNIYADVKADTLKKLLPIYDNLERALAQETQDEAYRKGVEMTMNQFRTALDALGVTAIETVGKPFDPTLHDAVMHIEDPDKGEQEIVAEFQKGFKMGDKVIRHSMVQVAN